MSELTKLINVNFEDLTSYATDTGSDVLGCPIEHCWGPSNRRLVLSLDSFLNFYPEAFPVGAPSSKTTDYMYGWAQVRRAFKAGIPAAEVVRAQGGWEFVQWNLSVTDDVFALTATEATTQFSDALTDLMSIAFKYAGRPPRIGAYSELVGFNLYVSLYPLGEDADINITIKGILADASEVLLESHDGRFNTEALLDGRSYYIKDVLERDSLLLECQINDDFDLPTVLTALDAEAPEFLFPTALGGDDFEDVVNEFYPDIDTSVATLLVAPLNGDSTINAALASIASSRKNCNFVLGFPSITPLTRGNVEAYITSSVPSATYDMFTNFVVGQEIYKVLGRPMYLDCTAAWCGLCAKVAKNVKINQLPSAKAYGSFDGVLTATLSFEDVLALHELNVISVYTSSTGARIFGVRSRHPRVTSYFSKANVMRVLARFLRDVFPECLNVIHTEVVSDATQRAKFSSVLNKIVDSYISSGNLNPASTVDVSDKVNSDAQTSGGEILNIVFTLWTKKLTEKINIKISVTDSSVTTNLS